MSCDHPDHFARLLDHRKMAQPQAAEQGERLRNRHCIENGMWRRVHEMTQVDCFLPIILGNFDIIDRRETWCVDYSLLVSSLTFTVGKICLAVRHHSHLSLDPLTWRIEWI